MRVNNVKAEFLSIYQSQILGDDFEALKIIRDTYLKMNFTEAKATLFDIDNHKDNGIIKVYGGITAINNLTVVNSAMRSSLFDVHTKAQITVSNSTFEKLASASTASSVMVTGSDNSFIKFENSLIMDTQSDASMVTLIISRLQFVNVTALGNYGYMIAHGFVLNKATVEIFNSTLNNDRNYF